MILAHYFDIAAICGWTDQTFLFPAEFFDDFDEVRVKMDQDITLEEHYEVLMGLPRFDEDPEGSVERLPFSSGDKVSFRIFQFMNM
eukprot:1348889-Amorphochlora_amoeboformis.AAC.1